jgi:hypothetical protein
LQKILQALFLSASIIYLEVLPMAGKRDPDKVKAALMRAEVLTPERRAEIAREAALARWGNKPPTATHKGSFKEEFGIDVECYVLDDAQKTAVISQRGMGQALGMSERGNALPRFLSTQLMADFVGAEIRQKFENPLKFQSSKLGAGPTVHGFDVTLLIDICKAVIAAESSGKLGGARYANIARQAHIIVGASAKAGIKQLVYALAGYNPTAEEVIAAFKLYVQEEAKKYEPEFPNELYAEWYRLYSIPVLKRGKPWHFKYLTVNHVYHPLAESSGNILTLLRALKARGGDQKTKLFQFLNQIGARALRIQLGRILEMAQSSPDKQTYERKIVERFGGQREFEFIVPAQPTETKEAAG